MTIWDVVLEESGQQTLCTMKRDVITRFHCSFQIVFFSMQEEQVVNHPKYTIYISLL